MRKASGWDRLRLGPVMVMCLCALLLTGSPAGATLVTLTDADSVVKIDTGNQQGVYSWTVDGTQQLKTQWFWYRVGDVGSEASIDTLTLGSETIGTSSLDVTYSGTGFTIQIVFTLLGGSVGSQTSDLAETIKIHNTQTSGSLDFRFFQYADFDLNGTPNNETSMRVNANTVDQSDELYIIQETVATPAPSHWEMALTTTTLDKLNDANPTTLSDISPAGPGNATWAFEWDKSISAGGTLLISKDKNITTIIPEPLTMLGVFLGLGSVGAYIRRRRML